MASAEAWVSTVGAGLWRAGDLGHWRREPAVPDTGRLFALAADGDLLVAGGEGCVYFPGTAASTVWSIAAADGQALAAAIGGELFSSEDDGRTWARLPQTFAEVRAVLFH